jgi:hypothetical protein
VTVIFARFTNSCRRGMQIALPDFTMFLACRSCWTLSGTVHSGGPAAVLTHFDGDSGSRGCSGDDRLAQEVPEPATLWLFPLGAIAWHLGCKDKRINRPA